MIDPQSLLSKSMAIELLSSQHDPGMRYKFRGGVLERVERPGCWAVHVEEAEGDGPHEILNINAITSSSELRSKVGNCVIRNKPNDVPAEGL